MDVNIMCCGPIVNPDLSSWSLLQVPELFIWLYRGAVRPYHTTQPAVKKFQLLNFLSPQKGSPGGTGVAFVARLPRKFCTPKTHMAYPLRYGLKRWVWVLTHRIVCDTLGVEIDMYEPMAKTTVQP